MNDFNYYYEKYGELYLKQLELEAMHKEEAETILKMSLEKAQQECTVASTKIGGKLVDVAWVDVSKNMEKLIDDVKKPKSGVVAGYTPLLKDLIKIYRNKKTDLINLFTLSSLSTLIDSCFSTSGAGISNVSITIVDNILKEANIERFIQFENVKDANCLKGIKLEKSLDAGIKKRVEKSYRIQYVNARMRTEGYQALKYSKEEKLRLGAKLLELATKGSGFFKIEEVDINAYVSKNNFKGTKMLACVVPNDWLIETWQKNADIQAKFAHKFMPTLIPPKHWTDPYNGGYYGEMQAFSSLIRLDHVNSNVFVKQYKRKLEAVDLSFIYKALNAMQDTPFKINKFILEVSEQILAQGGNLGGFVQTEPYEMLPKLVGDYTEEELKTHKKKQVGIIKRNQSRQSKAMRALIACTTARKYADYDKIYFPWNMDYRGRCYPMTTTLSPQGDDITKALLVFAEPAPCKNPDDYKWLAIHGANLAGHDKISFAERIKWVKDNEENIIASANDPLGYTWWSKEAENDYPMEFLAFCNEWKKLKTYIAEHGSCVGFKSEISIAFDGTCSGLQHFSAILHDEVGGYAVNLTPTDKVQDIYSIVADKVNKVLFKDAQNGTPDEAKRDKKGQIVVDHTGKTQMKLGTKNLAQQWLIFARDKYGTEGITRKVCKRSVMTLAYGSGRYGFAENVSEDIIKPFIQAHPDTAPFNQPKQSSTYMAGLIWDAVGTTVVKAVEGMKYLQDVAKLICKDRNVVTWITPNGLPIQQNYMEVEQKVFQMRISGLRHRFYSLEETGNIDSRGQAQGIAPNFIHSMDATHLQRVVVASCDEGNTNFAMIHDSFGTDMAHAGRLFGIIREQFVKLYKDTNHLQNFLDNVKYMLDEEDIERISIPAFGSLDIEEVIKSDFCFA